MSLARKLYEAWVAELARRGVGVDETFEDLSPEDVYAWQAVADAALCEMEERMEETVHVLRRLAKACRPIQAHVIAAGVAGAEIASLLNELDVLDDEHADEEG